MTNIIIQIDDYIGRTGESLGDLFKRAGLDKSNYYRWRGYYDKSSSEWSHAPNMRNVEKVIEAMREAAI